MQQRRIVRTRDLASFREALIELATETETPLPAIFGLMRLMLAHLASGTPPAPTIFAFEIRLLGELGLKPDLTQARLSDGAKAILKMLGDSGWDSIPRLRLSKAQAGELGRFLDEFLAYHLGRVPRGRDAALGTKEHTSSAATAEMNWQEAETQVRRPTENG